VSHRAKYSVIDGLMDETSLDALRAHLGQQPYFFDNALEWKKVWHPLDGQVLVTSPSAYGDTGRTSQQYPTGTPLDLFFAAMERNADAIAATLQLELDEIKYVASAYLYRAGWGLSWHDDAGPYRGAFAYYIHPEWRGNWGGELMILEEPRLRERPAGGVDLGYAVGGFQEPAYCATGRGDFIMPLPNRLVVMSKALLHRINPVAPHAGEHLRYSIAGFFL
jgi:Rps23 Pro-64 3,4-dihydroxylase Tpa1-like proline 4-hydroxylase